MLQPNIDTGHHCTCRSVLGPFLKSCGFREAAVQWLPASAPAGQNLVGPPSDARLAAWWGGAKPCLTGAIDGFAPAGRAAAQMPLRIPVGDVFRGIRGNSLLGGKLEVGTPQFSFLESEFLLWPRAT